MKQPNRSLGAAQEVLSEALFGGPDDISTSSTSWTGLSPGERSDVVALASDHRVLATLAARLVDDGAIRSVSSPAVAAIMTRVRDVDPNLAALVALQRSDTRVAALMVQLANLGEAWTDAGVAFIPLKGAHQQRARWWPRPGARAMGDLDVLIWPDHMALATEVANELGCQPVGPLGERNERPRGRLVPGWLLRIAHRPIAQLSGHHAHPLVLPKGVGLLELHHQPVITSLAPSLSNEECFAAMTEPSVLADHLAVRQIVLHDVVVDCFHPLHRKPFRAATDLAARVRASHLGPVDFDRVFGVLYDRGFGSSVDIVVELLYRHGSGLDVPRARERGETDRWFRRSDRFEHQLARGPVATYVRTLDRHHLAANYGTVALDHPWWTRLQHLLSAADRRHDGTVETADVD